MGAHWLIRTTARTGEVVAWFYMRAKDDTVFDDGSIYEFCLSNGVRGDKWVSQIVGSLTEPCLGVAEVEPTFSDANADVWLLGITPPATNPNG